MRAKARQPWVGILLMAGAASVVVSSCGGRSEHESGGGAASGAGGSRAVDRGGMPGTAGGPGETISGGGASGYGTSQEGSGGSRASGNGGGVAAHGAASGASSGGHSASPGSLHACGNPSAWSVNIELCDTGFVHRTSDAACPLPAHLEEGGAAGVSLVRGARVDCLSDSDCGRDDEFCVLAADDVNEGVATRCQSSCVTNEDCASGEVCSCNPTFRSATAREPLTLGICTRAGCLTDADCADGALCAAELVPDIYAGCDAGILELEQFQCQSERDECSGPGDCPPKARDWQVMGCPYEDGHRPCVVNENWCYF